MYFIIFLSISLAQNFSYEDEDWYSISNPGSIKSITSAYDQIFFCSDNGIFTYDILNSSLIYDQEYIMNFNSSTPLLIHYDEYTDYMWFLNDKGLYYKPRISTFWREVSFYKLGLSSFVNIKNIGSNYEFIFLDLGHSILTLDSITGNVAENINIEYESVKWSSSLKNNTINNYDLSSYFSFEGYSIVSENKIEFNGQISFINCIYKDKYNDFWLGSNRGEVFYCDSKMNSFKKIDSIPIISNINRSYIDTYNEWWFSTKDDILFSDDMFSNHPIFISNWNESSNIWRDYTKNKYLSIESRDITSFSRVDNFLYIGTQKGLLIFDIKSKDWKLIDQSDGLSSNFINDIEFANNNIYIANADGLSILTTLGNNILDIEVLNIFNKNSVFNINHSKEKLLIASQIGIFEYDYKNNLLHRLQDKKYFDAEYSGENIILTKRNKVLKSDNEKLTNIFIGDRIQSTSVCNEFIWINNINKASIYSLSNRSLFEYNQDDGIIGDIIHDIDCDNDWVWFSTNKGLSIFNWSKYHYDKK
jgi:ligand-binding sensor domain-containing protein